jgi:arginase
MATSARRPFEIIGAEFDSGGRVRGTSLAPKTLREYGLLERLLQVDSSVVEGTDVAAPGHGHRPSGKRPGPPEVNDLAAAELFSKALYSHTREVLYRGNRPLLIGGDHSISIATVSAVVDHYRRLKGSEAPVGLLWVDAHPDLNTPESSPSGNLHGMVARTLLGEGPASLVSLGETKPKLKPHQLAQLGLRDVDPPERQYIRSAGITACSMRDIDCMGVYACMQRCLDALAACSAGIYVSFDLDVCDPSIAPGVDTPVRGGLSFREAHLVMELVAERHDILGIELVEYDPKFDQSHTSADLAIALLESALGKSIL